MTELYDKYIVAFSGGKDSIAAFLHLLETGVPEERIELWHHDVDGRGETFMDWECTSAYCRAFAAHFFVDYYESWKHGGFMTEMLRENSLTAPTSYETPEGIKTSGGITGKLNTRRKFPQVSPDLRVRWCSAYLKIDVMKSAIANQKRFIGLRTLVVTGERGEESPQRDGYKQREPHSMDNRRGKKGRRHVDHYRPVLRWKEKRVWQIIKRYRIRVHPAYYLGWNRVSCKFCIFGGADQMASAFKVSPAIGSKIAGFEKQFGCTIKRKMTINELVAAGTPYNMAEETIAAALNKDYDLPMTINPWVIPAGAYGEGCGPQ